LLGSKYNVFIADFPFEGKWLVYNTLCRNSAIVGSKIKELLEDSLQPIPVENRSDGQWDKLRRAGIVVTDHRHEEEQLRNYFNARAESKKSLCAIIMTTYACNLACPFCIENGVKSSVHMTEETTQRVIDWLKQGVEANSPEKISLAFYGGEPTIHLPPMKAICREMQTICRQRGMELDVGLTTNGTLLTGEMADELVDFGLAWAVIAVAGNKEVHDRMRPFTGGKGSFDVIFQNIREISDKINVVIKGIYDDENEESLLAMMDGLVEMGLGHKIHNIGFDPVIENLSAVNGLSPTCGVCSYSNSNLDTNLRLIKEALKRDLEANLNFSMGPCSTILNRNHITIDPSGIFYKCPAFAGHEMFAVGDIWNGADHRFEYFLESQPWEECLDCRYVPVCGGGCRFSAYLENQDCRSVVCERLYFERVGIHIMEIVNLKKIFNASLDS
jgi:uncharacterized protein